MHTSTKRVAVTVVFELTVPADATDTQVETHTEDELIRQSALNWMNAEKVNVVSVDEITDVPMQY